MHQLLHSTNLVPNNEVIQRLDSSVLILKKYDKFQHSLHFTKKLTNDEQV